MATHAGATALPVDVVQDSNGECYAGSIKLITGATLGEGLLSENKQTTLKSSFGGDVFSRFILPVDYDTDVSVYMLHCAFLSKRFCTICTMHISRSVL